MTEIVRDPDHSDGAPTIEETGIRVWNVASAYEHSGYSPDEIIDLYPVLTLEDVNAPRGQAPGLPASTTRFASTRSR
ncbi:hypothetical protein BRD02_07460 [Halobacteriales archaeon QS_8_69_73]|nr:MAG: hypothetical protein BRD02_07460 [Halobacteriales archaeon QS_8_69_73]